MRWITLKRSKISKWGVDAVLKVVQHGDFRKVDGFLEKIKEVVKMGDLNKYGRMGVDALRKATPVDTGIAANGWYYDIVREDGKTKIIWSNDDIEGGYNVILLLQYGHATKNGKYVEGIDFINPALKDTFDYISEQAFEEVMRIE